MLSATGVLGGATDVLHGVGHREPTRAFASQVAEECRRLLSSLGDADLQQIAEWKMEEYTLAEIAARLGCVPRTVRRRLQRIRTIWREAIGRGWKIVLSETAADGASVTFTAQCL